MRGLTLISTAVSVLALAVSGAGFLPVKLAYNGSASAPIGFYWVDDKPVANGDYVLIRPPAPVETIIETRNYLPPNAPLIKRVAAVEGDVVCRLERQISINGITVAVALPEDNAGRPMQVWQGCVVISLQQIFLLQPHPHSFDSRYFGPIARSLIIGRAVLLRWPWRKDEQE